MDPFSITAGVVGMLGCVTKLSCTINGFRHDYKVADEDLEIARQHALLLQEEIRALESAKASKYSQQNKSVRDLHGSSYTDDNTTPVMEEASFTKAISTAHELLSTIESCFPLRSEPHTWRSKVRWVMKDKVVLAQLKERLKSTESTLQGIATMEQLRVSNMIYGVLLQQQSTLDKLGRGEITAKSVINMAVVNQSSPQSLRSESDSQLAITKPTRKRSTQWMTRRAKLLPSILDFGRQGFSAQLVASAKDRNHSYQISVDVPLFGKMYSIELQMSYPAFTFDCMLHVRNIVPSDCAMAVACKTGDFDNARKILASGAAHGNDITEAGLPMLDLAIENGSARLVRLLLEYGAQPDMGYGEHNMTALQSSFLRGQFNIARLLLTRGADIERVDSDGYSVLSYLWVVDKPSEKSVDFMRLCLANGFSEVNACDSRGWSAFQRAAAIGTSEDVDAFLRLGASLDLRADWYGWTALFFAASHDNVETFQTIVRHSPPNVYESLDGDGWTLLHCCIYFGAPCVMRLVLLNGIDVNQLTHPAPLPEDPEMSYRELTPSDIAVYIGPNRVQMFMEALAETGRDVDLEGNEDIYWDVAPNGVHENSEGTIDSRPVYGAEDVDDDRWTLLHWASYNGSTKVKKLLLLKGVDSEHMDAVSLEENPTLLRTSPFDGH